MSVQLSAMYDADRRRTDPDVHRLAARLTIPHPLAGVQYADGIRPCTHVGKHHTPGTCTPRPEDPR